MSSSDLEYHLFTRNEMEMRYARARELMGQQGIDALFITGEENFQYFAGTSAAIGLHHSLTRPSVFILPMNREPIILTQGRDNLTLGCYITDIRDYFGVFQFPHDQTLEALHDAGLRNNRIGAELGQEQRMGMPVGAYLAIVNELPSVEFVDAADIIIKLRMVKSAEELVYIRHAADITGRARQRLYDGHLVPGMTEREAVRALRRLILEEGGDRTSFVHVQLDVQSAFPGAKNQFHYDRPLRSGTIIGLDTGAYVHQYTVDYPRFAALGGATEEQRRLHEAVKRVNKKMADALRPGVTCSEIHAVGVRAIEAETGLDRPNPEVLARSRMGHGQGMLLTEPPSITPLDLTVLEAGMVISTEPKVSFGPLEFLWEDTHVVTEHGHEQLTLETDELREIPF